MASEITDTIQAIAIARRGHGDMALTAALASQNMNVFLGCGLPWFLACVTNSDKGIAIEVENPEKLPFPLTWLFWATLVVRVVMVGLTCHGLFFAKVASFRRWLTPSYTSRRRGRREETMVVFPRHLGYANFAFYVGLMIVYLAASILFRQQTEGAGAQAVHDG